MADRFSTDLRRRNYNNRGLIRHHFTDKPCRVEADGTLWAFVVRSYKEGLLLKSADGGFTWSKIYNSADPQTEDLWYHTTPRSQAGLDVQGPIVNMEILADADGIFLFTGGDNTVAFTHLWQFISTMTDIAQSSGTTLLSAGLALEGVFGTTSYQHQSVIGFVKAADSSFGIERVSAYDGSSPGPVYESSYEYLNRFDLVVNGETGYVDIVVQSDEGSGAGVTYPFLGDFDYTEYAYQATCCALTYGGNDYIDAFGVAESKHCCYLHEIIVAGDAIPNVYYDSELGCYIFQMCSLTYGGNDYSDSYASTDSHYCCFYGGTAGGSIYLYKAGNTDANTPQVREPLALKGYGVYGMPYDGANVDGSTDIDIVLTQISGNYITILVESSLRSELVTNLTSSGYSVDLQVPSVYTANGVGSDYTFDETAITGAGATLWGADGADGKRWGELTFKDVGAPSATNAPEPEFIKSANFVFLGIDGLLADTLVTEDVDIILATSGGGDRHTFLTKQSNTLNAGWMLGSAGYTVDLTIRSVFQSTGSGTDMVFDETVITGAGATLWGGDGAGGERTPGGTPADVGLRHFRFNLLNGTFGSVHSVSPATVASVALARDGYGTLCAVWGEISGSDINIKCGISIDNGVSWAPMTFTMGGSATFEDTIASEIDARIDVIGGEDGGFLFMYVRDNSSGVPRLYIHQVTTSDGSTYTVGSATEATSRPTDESIVGGRFFKPQEDSLISLAVPGFVRIAYQVGEGNSELMLDTVPVRFAQELLTTAFPVSSSSEDTTPNQDFYTAGMTGAYTTKYLAAFNKLGTTFLVRKYEPDTDAQMGDRTAYGEPTEYTPTCMIDPKTYLFPQAEFRPEDQVDYIEQDIRKIYFKPDFPILRTFVLNDGGFLKRTVWTVLHDGNEYEISQVVPRFIDDQIVYYEANIYVIGPSRDPWARVVLPSET